jgi:hypothetical protein
MYKGSVDYRMVIVYCGHACMSVRWPQEKGSLITLTEHGRGDLHTTNNVLLI